MWSLFKNLSRVLAFSAFAFALNVRAELSVGQPCPALASFGLDKQLPELSGKVVLLDFWASWCGPCKTSFPEYSKLHHALAAQGLVIIAVSVDTDARNYTAFTERLAPAFFTCRDTNQKLVAAFNPPAMPSCYLIDRHGNLRSLHTGFHGESTLASLRTELTALLAEHP